ncbi:hypothetical protein [Pseudomonas putida]|uniref:hypothetical protein n=1 Tax=Pseudomonas putida TaxID=303 RepID=UPI0022DD122A|nr:hypothetical protein [Pseudomonas putida]WBM44672.1 hypothetical protein M2J85_18220 [Pseudomonas putida]
MNFKLENYSKKKNEEPQFPAWAKSDVTRNLYKKTLDMSEHIKKQMLTQKDMSLKSRKIVIRTLAAHCNVSPSLITSRRQPDLVIFINKTNAELEEHWDSVKNIGTVSGRKLTKAELKSQFDAMKEEIAYLKNLRIAEAFTLAIRENLAESRSSLIIQIEKLEIDINELREENLNLKKLNRQLLTALNK